MQKQTTHKMVLLALLVAMSVVLARLCSIQLFVGPTAIVRISLGFLPLVMAGVLHGPVAAGIACAAADVIGYFINPAGVYFPGITVTAFLAGLAYGFFLYRKPLGIARITVMAVCVSVLLHLGLNTVWISMLAGKAYLVILYGRVAQEAVMLPVTILCTYAVGNAPQLRRILPRIS